MPFGLKTAPAEFQRLIELTLTGLIGMYLIVYLDDIVICANTLEEYEIKFNNLVVKLEKQIFIYKQTNANFYDPK